jgi:chorismate mutase
MKKQSAGELSRTISGQMSKTEKRMKLARDIGEHKQKAHQAVKAFKRAQFQG